MTVEPNGAGRGRRVWPIRVAISVVLPTPLRPSTASRAPAATANDTPSRMRVSPYPASRPSTSSGAADMAVAPKIGLAETHSLPETAGGIAFEDHAARRQHQRRGGRSGTPCPCRARSTEWRCPPVAPRWRRARAMPPPSARRPRVRRAAAPWAAAQAPARFPGDAARHRRSRAPRAQRRATAAAGPAAAPPRPASSRSRAAARNIQWLQPRRSSTASATFSRTVKSRNSRVTWKLRTRPRCTRASMPSVVTSSPASTMRPADGASAPVTRLTKVVLPAPLGPIRATRSPSASVSDTSRVTARPPKLRVRCSTASRAVMVLASPAIRRRTVSPAPCSPPGRNSTTATSRAPTMVSQWNGLAADTRCSNSWNSSVPDQRAIERAGAAEHQHHQRLGRALEAQTCRARRRRCQWRQARRRARRQNPRSRTCAPSVGTMRPPIARTPQRVLLDGAADQPERRTHQAQQQHESHQQQRGPEQISGARIKVEGEQTEHRPRLDARQAIAAAGDRRRLVGQCAGELHQCDRQHQLRQAVIAHDQGAREHTGVRRRPARPRPRSSSGSATPWTLAIPAA